MTQHSHQQSGQPPTDSSHPKPLKKIRYSGIVPLPKNTTRESPPKEKAVQVFVRFHSNELNDTLPSKASLKNLPNPYITGGDIKFEAYKYYLLWVVPFERWMQNPSACSAMEVFVKTFQHHIYPPLEVLKLFARGFEKFLGSQGRIPLEECLALVGPKGHRGYFLQLANHVRDYNLCRKVFDVRHLMGISIADASEMAAEWYKDLLETVQKFPPSHNWFRWDGTIGGMMGKPLTPETIAERYKKDKEWRRIRKAYEEIVATDPKAAAIAKKMYQEKDERKEFLSEFPFHSLPLSLQPYHPDFHNQ